MNWQNLLGYSASADWILLTAFHAFWLSLAAFLVMRLRRFRAPAVRSAGCICALILLLALPMITWVVSRSSVAAQPVQKAAIETSVAIVETQAPLLNRVLDIKTLLPQARTSRWKALTNQFGFLWLTVTLICIGRLLYQLAFLRGYCTSLQEIQDGRISAILRECSHSFHFRKKPRFYISHLLTSPISTGIQTPLVILPASLYQGIGDKELRAILLHELAHIYHHDHVLGLLQRMIGALYWWNPFVYGLCNSLSVAREEVSDNYAISAMESAASYARLLVSLVEKTSLISRMPCTAGMATPYESLEARIRNIVCKERDMRVKTNNRMRLAILSTSILLCMVVVIGSQVTVFGDGQTSASGHKENSSQAASASEVPVTIKADGQAIGPKLVHRVDPVYPEQALKARVQGKVTLAIDVNDEGLVTDARVMQGHPVLNDAAIAAVRQWKYLPTLLNGKPVPVKATVTVIFNLGRGNEQAMGSKLVHLGRGNEQAMESKLVHRVEPVYPEQALKARVQGKVILAIDVNEEGVVTDARVVQGHPLLDDAAIAAVRQWKYSPTLLNGRPVPVKATVSIIFNMGRD